MHAKFLIFIGFIEYLNKKYNLLDVMYWYI